ncbi:MAG TPA: flagellar basal-body MS-ring/collar protein FliF [Solirubrobacteraceae bacterium]|jgi:flagellar M-ring protein FliF
MPNVAQLASRLSTRGWLIAGGGTIGAILLIYMLLHVVSQPSYSTLVTGLEPAQTGKMTNALSEKGISYQLQNNGTALAVQSNETAQARIALSSAGLLENTAPGFSLFEKTSLGESSFQQQVTYQRALQGQLEQTIDQIDGVEGAQVELVLPNAQSQLFAESQSPSSAAVLLSGATSLEPSEVRGIAHLVTSSVQGLKLGNVTITNGEGQLLWPTQGSEGGEGTSKQTAQTHYDEQMDASLAAMLAQTLGPNKAQVQVYANLDVNHTTEEQLTYGKQGVPITESKNIETLKGSGAGAGGASSTAAVPNYAQSSSGGNSNYKHEVTSSTMGVDKTVKHSTIAPGEVTNEHVSVLLDKSVPNSELPAIKEAISNAAGIESKRGDTIYIGRMAFAKPPASASASATSGMIGYAKDALLGLAAIAFLFFSTRFLRKREHDTIAHEPIWLSELEMPMRLAELERETSSQQEPELIGAGNNARRQVEALASSSPDKIAQQLRTWMKED